MLNYLRGTVGYGLRYVSGSELKLQGYMDLNLAASVEDRKSRSGSYFNLGLSMIS